MAMDSLMAVSMIQGEGVDRSVYASIVNEIKDLNPVVMGGRFEKGSSSPPSKRRRRDYDCAESSAPRRKQHLYLALDDWEGGYSIHKLDVDKILDEATDSGGERKLPEPAAFRIRSPVCGPIDFAALGTDIFFAANPRYYFGQHPPPTFVYETNIAALAVGPPLPTGIHSLEAAMALGQKLYVLTSPCLPETPPEPPPTPPEPRDLINATRAAVDATRSSLATTASLAVIGDAPASLATTASRATTGAVLCKPPPLPLSL
ncbi:hypothetical protein TRIUR3_30119 [Triticum urartu]|uniref:Uncharacterized protein n=1 Tax=Triticum urartu TaxID=4572 RepID=M7Z8T8_TRIUA|nr:hypothetical protein TRIUR3_30119 [Triticum urartu]